MQTIILVEDNLDLRVLLHTVLSRAFPDVALHEAATGRAFLLLLELHQPDLVLLDVQLPDISGLSLYQVLRLRPDLQEAPVLFVTANAELVHKAALSGPYACLAKPFNIAALVTHAQALLSQHATAKALETKDTMVKPSCEQVTMP
jgi:DNA-binding response OmpR family regulator